MDFAPFDVRNYRTLAVRDGYRVWAPTYEDTVEDVMDLRLLRRIQTVDWAACETALDLACGTGRIGAWLQAQGVATLDGVDFTAEMLDHAVAAYREALRLAPDNATLHASLGAILRKHGRPQEAIAACRVALRRRENVPEAHYDLGLILL